MTVRELRQVLDSVNDDAPIVVWLADDPDFGTFKLVDIRRGTPGKDQQCLVVEVEEWPDDELLRVY